MADNDRIIDLTDEVVETSPEDETIIELTDVVSPDEEVIELTETVEEDASTEPVIDLMEEATVAGAAVVPPVDTSPEVEETAAGPDEIEAEAPPEAAAADETTATYGVFETMGTEPVTEDAAISHTEGEGEPDDAPDAAAAPSESDLGDVVYFDDDAEEDYETASENDFVESLGMALDDTGEDEAEPEIVAEEVIEETTESILQDAPPAPVAAAPVLDIPEDQLEAAIEKAVENAVSGKIEAILVQVVENAVSREIEKIKKAILDEMAD
jgi:hypothetical protein